jgi:DNA-binding NarL/FixJ family response regulator
MNSGRFRTWSIFGSIYCVSLWAITTGKPLWLAQFVPIKMTKPVMSRYRVLIVDDHELVRRGLKDILRGTDFEVCGEAENGQEGLAQTVSLKPDLVLLDMSMPVLTGLQAAAKIRRILPETKILIVTMHDSPQMEIEARAAGADAYVTKMAAANSLLDAMRELFSKPSSTRQVSV